MAWLISWRMAAAGRRFRHPAAPGTVFTQITQTQRNARQQV